MTFRRRWNFRQKMLLRSKMDHMQWRLSRVQTIAKPTNLSLMLIVIYVCVF